MSAAPARKAPKRVSISSTARAGLIFPVGRIRAQIRKHRYVDRLSNDCAVTVASVMEYMFNEILELAGNAARDNKRNRILSRHLMLAVQNDAELRPLFKHATFAASGVVPYIDNRLLPRGMKGRKHNAVAAAGE